METIYVPDDEACSYKKQTDTWDEPYTKTSDIKQALEKILDNELEAKSLHHAHEILKTSLEDFVTQLEGEYHAKRNQTIVVAGESIRKTSLEYQ